VAVPDTSITAAPPASTTATAASFSFTSSPSGATFECSLDSAAFAACTSPASYTSLALGSHTFRVRAVNASGTDATPATHAWTIVAANQAPTADNDGPYVATGTAPLTVAAAQGVLAGDTDPEGTPLSAVLVSGPAPAGGTLTLNANGSFTYTHNVNPASPATVTFTYRASDGALTSNIATVTITVNPEPVQGCTAAPAAPSGLGVSVSGRTLTLNWTAPAGPVQNAPTSYRIEAGLAPGSTLQALSTGSSATTFVQGGIPGTFYLRVRGVNACGTGAASNEVAVTVQ
jgi:hypothetical protein